ncbi:MAG: ADP-ribose pyrophosphatase [Candidatus Woesearchaeota archaeon]|nr:ADP-ribose pyrophosphatase [Candidatus Woesearchaeota archaeon]
MKSRVVVVGVITYQNKILMRRKQKDRGPYPNTWMIPGGGVDLGEESLVQALKREVLEETGLSIKNIEQIGFSEDKEPNKHGEMTHYLFLEFLAESTSKHARAGSDLIKLKWFDKSELKDLKIPPPSVKIFKKLGYSV